MRRGPRWGEDWNGFDWKCKTLVIGLGESLRWVNLWDTVSSGSGSEIEEAMDARERDRRFRCILDWCIGREKLGT